MRRLLEMCERPRCSFLCVVVATVVAVMGAQAGGAAVPAAAAVAAKRIPSTATVTATPNPVTVGQSTTLNVTVTCDALIPTGTASFFDGAVLLGVVPLSGGSAALTSDAFTVGAHFITVIYSGDINCDPAAGGVTLDVDQAASTASVTAAPNPATQGQPVTLTATVTCGAGTPTGTVQFSDGGTVLGTVALSGGSASLTTGALALGSHQITAAYGGDVDCAAATSAPHTVTVTAARGSSTTTLRAYPPRPRPRDPLLLIARVACTTGQPTGSVSFRDNGRLLATSPVAAQSAIWLIFRMTAGRHQITATYNGSTGCGPSTSVPISLVVTRTSDR